MTERGKNRYGLLVQATSSAEPVKCGAVSEPVDVVPVGVAVCEVTCCIYARVVVAAGAER